MSDEKLLEGHRVPEGKGRASFKITLSMDELNASLDSFLVEPARLVTRGRVAAAVDTADIDCTDGATCNFKCGPTAYWECGPTTPEGTCPGSGASNCFTCYPYCVTEYAAGDPFC